MLDVRLDNARDIRPQLAAANPARGATFTLPFRVIHDGVRYDSVIVGHGWVQLASRQTRASTEGVRPTAPLGRAAQREVKGPRFNLVAGDAVRATGAPVMLLESDAGIVVRYTELSVPGRGTATAELVLDREGHVTIQYLRLSPAVATGLADGSLTHGTTGQARAKGLHPGSATSFSLVQPQVELKAIDRGLPGTEIPRPFADGPPPAGCDPPAGNWCDRVKGTPDPIILIAEAFDDGLSTTRGWSGTGLWHESTFPVCLVGIPPDEVGGASRAGGEAWYFGDDGTCQYVDNVVGSLRSPTSTELVTADTRMDFQFRLEAEINFDTAEIWFNGVPVANLDPTGLDPDAWYNVSLESVNSGSTWFLNDLGLPLFVEFVFSSDAIGSNYLGWFVDDVRVYDEVVGKPNCILAVESGANSSTVCDQVVSDEWFFNESAFCEGCDYSFYVVVDCGREMHLPLNDMEGASISVTNVITGQPVSLRCWNETARADAGLGPYPEFLSGTCPGCPPPAPQTWWGPPFDETDNQGVGSVGWGFPDCPGVGVYDVLGDGLDCGDLPCGGELPLINPGESQTMDCYIEDDTGLCGLYRVDVTSGGFEWRLFANCDGTDTPRYDIYQDCTEAWTAYEPLPELAVANLSVPSDCPDLMVSFDLINLGCVEYPGDVIVRLSTDCMPAGVDDMDFPILGPFAANSTTPVSLPFTASCAPVRVEVTVDPDDLLPECTESPTARSCAAEAGVDSLATFSCGCDAMLTVDAGPAQYACPGDMIQLDGSASVIAPCAVPLYRWLDGAGTPLGPFSPDPTTMVTVDNCPGGLDFTLEVQCEGEGCIESGTTRVECLVPVAEAGEDQRVCVGNSLFLDARDSTIDGCASLEYRWLDSRGLELRAYSPDPTLDLGLMDCALSDDYTVEVRCAGAGACFDSDIITVVCVEIDVDIIPESIFACEGEPFPITSADVVATSDACVMLEYRWLDGVSGTPLTPWAPEPDVVFNGFMDCPTGALATLEVRCGDPGLTDCVGFTNVNLICLAPPTPVPTSTDVCGGPSADLDCGVGLGVGAFWWDLDLADDADGNGDPTDDVDVATCAGTATFPAPGVYTVRSWAEEPDANCRAFTDLEVEVFADPEAPVPTVTPGCPNATSALSCGTDDPSYTYTWDLDIAVDADGDTVPDNDLDAAGCNQDIVYDAGTRSARVAVTDSRGCSVSADIEVIIDADAVPPEVGNVRVTHDAGTVALSWDPVPEMGSTYRVLRGLLFPLALSSHTMPAYDHAADDSITRGACNVGTMTMHVDADDGGDGGTYYYIVTAVSPCGIEEGSTGTDTEGTTRPPRTSMASCP